MLRWWREHRYLMQARPNSGRLWLDLVYLLIVIVIHTSVFPSLTGAYVRFDCITPWLLIGFVYQPPLLALGFATFSGLLVETHSASPAGLYICIFWVQAVAVYLARGALSWHLRYPWLATFTICGLWAVGFETFVVIVEQGQADLPLEFVSAQACRLLSIIVIGMMLASRVRRDHLEEDGP